MLLLFFFDNNNQFLRIIFIQSKKIENMSKTNIIHYIIIFHYSTNNINYYNRIKQIRPAKTSTEYIFNIRFTKTKKI